MNSKRITITIPPDLASLISDLAVVDRRTVANWCHHQLKLAAQAAQAQPTPEPGKVVALFAGIRAV